MAIIWSAAAMGAAIRIRQESDRQAGQVRAEERESEKAAKSAAILEQQQKLARFRADVENMQKEELDSENPDKIQHHADQIKAERKRSTGCFGGRF